MIPNLSRRPPLSLSRRNQRNLCKLSHPALIGNPGLPWGLALQTWDPRNNSLIQSIHDPNNYQ
jgi:hypothetical protein